MSHHMCDPDSGKTFCGLDITEVAETWADMNCPECREAARGFEEELEGIMYSIKDALDEEPDAFARWRMLSQIEALTSKIQALQY